MKEFYSTKQVAEILDIHPQTVFVLIKKEKLQAVNIGTGKRVVYRISKDTLNEFYSRKKTKNPEIKIPENNVNIKTDPEIDKIVSENNDEQRIT